MPDGPEPGRLASATPVGSWMAVAPTSGNVPSPVVMGSVVVDVGNVPSLAALESMAPGNLGSRRGRGTTDLVVGNLGSGWGPAVMEPAVGRYRGRWRGLAVSARWSASSAEGGVRL